MADAADAARYEYFGYSVSISENYAIVSATNSAYIFKRDGSSWNQQIKLTVANCLSSRPSVSISDDYAIANIGCGQMHVFKRDGANWSQEIILSASYKATTISMTNCAISGESVIMGFDQYNIGSAYIFTLPPAAFLYEKGDINGDTKTDLADAVIALKVTAGVNIDGMIPAGYSMSDIDVNGDDRIGMEEVLYIMKKILFE